jgi:hypothetical protein
MKQTNARPRSSKRRAKVEKRTDIRFEDFGARVGNVWREMRPATRRLIERALQTSSPVAVSNLTSNSALKNSRMNSALYDARAEIELSRLLAALDERAMEASALDDSQKLNLSRAAETCAVVLQTEARSAEPFAQLLERALITADFARVDALCETLTARLAPSEICELARHEIAAIRALAFEALMQQPTIALVNLLTDPIDAETARAAIKGQAFEYDIEEAQMILSALEADELIEEI